ncbi:helix-turn-helix transcriptional regulator [Paracoccus amoyensis]
MKEPTSEAMMTDFGYGPTEATLGDRLMAAREAAGFSLEQLAERLELSSVTVEEWEADQSAPSDDGLGRIARLLDVSAGWLLDGEGAGLTSGADASTAAAEIQELRRILQDALQRLARLEGTLSDG